MLLGKICIYPVASISTNIVACACNVEINEAISWSNGQE